MLFTNMYSNTISFCRASLNNVCLGFYTMLKFNCTIENIILEEEKTMLQGEQDGNKCIQTSQRTLADLNNVCLGFYTMLKFNCTIENIILEEEKTMLQGEQDGNKCIQTAQRTLADLNKTMQLISSQLTSEESSAACNKFEKLFDSLEKSKGTMEEAINAARQGKEYYKKSKDVSFEIIRKQDKQQAYKIPLTGEYPCGLCHFKSRDETTVEKHIREYHRAATKQVKQVRVNFCLHFVTSSKLTSFFSELAQELVKIKDIQYSSTRSGTKRSKVNGRRSKSQGP